MPYTGKDDDKLPSKVKELPDKLREAWAKAWSASFKSCQDKKGEGIEGDCESYAFGTANNVVKRMQEKSEMGYHEALAVELASAEKSLDDVQRMIYDAFNTVYGEGYERHPMPCWIEEVFEDYVVARMGEKHYKVSYTIADEKVTFASRDKWEPVIEDSKWVPAPKEMNMGAGVTLLAVELSDEALVEGKAFDGLTSGEFADMRGTLVKVKNENLETCLQNTLDAIAATKSESGEIVGLPIDAHGHEKGDGAGWIVGASLEDGKLRLIPKWTEIGKELIGKGIRRFFSATVDHINWVILGGTLTNWPAVRDKKGRVLLRPLELQQHQNLEVDMTKEEIEALVKGAVADALKDRPPAPAPTPGNGNIDLVSLLGLEGLSEEAKKTRKEELRQQVLAWQQQAELELRAEMRKAQHEGQMTELAQELTGGNDSAPRGYRVAAEELKLHLLKLDPDEAKFWGELLRKSQSDGFIEYGEVGHGRDPKGLKPLPEEYARKLDSGVLAIADLSAPESGLGDLAQYDLSKWRKQEA
jgi:cation transport regulator ChaB